MKASSKTLCALSVAELGAVSAGQTDYTPPRPTLWQDVKRGCVKGAVVWGTWGAIVGGFKGALVGSPFFGVGAAPGAAIGAVGGGVVYGAASCAWNSVDAVVGRLLE